MAKKLNILFILPYDTAYRYKRAFIPSLSYQPLTLSVLAALVPEDLDARITLVDEGVQVFDYEKEAYDIVGISICTSGAGRGYELARFFKEKGSFVLIGGHHATLLPEEAALHADSVFTGSAEKTLPEFFRDYITGGPKKLYRSTGLDAAAVPVPRRDLMPGRGYLKQTTIIADYGCANHCAYCVIPSFWGGGARRLVSDVIAEMRGCAAKEYLFLDPSPLCCREYAKELFSEMRALKIKWAGLATLDVAEDAELLALMRESGCVGTLLGFETFSQQDLDSMGKYKNKTDAYAGVIEKLHAHGIAVLGTFMLGMDGDTRESLAALPELIEKVKIDVPRFAILTPYPGTALFERLANSERILTRDWSKYDGLHCVFRPANITPEETELAFLRVWRECYGARRILARTAHTPRRKITSLITNTAFRIYADRLEGLL